MKKKVTLTIAGTSLCILCIGAVIWQQSNSEASRGISPIPNGMSAMERMRKLGPVVMGMGISERVGNVKLHVKADRLSAEKTKIFWFDSNLRKKMIALNLHFKITKDKTPLLILSKDRAEFSPDKSQIIIAHPKVSFPENFGNPDEVKLDKKMKLLYIRRGDKTETWDLGSI